MNRRQTFKMLALGSVAAFGLSACVTTEGGDDIVDVASSNPDFSTLVAALGAADLVGTLQGPGPFTVFTPTNAAFDALPAGTVDSLLLPENKDTLTSILTYHVVPGAITADQLAGTQQAVATVNGQTVQVDGTSGVTVNGANVTTADITATNGVIHVIDTVLMPN